jgi:hypothetical protein
MDRPDQRHRPHRSRRVHHASPANRTSLSWQRTTAASALVALFAAFTAVRLGEPHVAIAAGALALLVLAVGATTPLVSRRHPESREPYGYILRAAVVLALTGALGVTLAVEAVVGG